MKKVSLFLLLIIIGLSTAESPKIIYIDDFEDGDITADPAWWTFGDSQVNVVSVPGIKEDKLAKNCGKQVLKIEGSTEAWYIGGMGCYLAQDATAVNAVKFMVYGNGPQSGRITIQLYDDDNNNEELEQDVERNYEPIFDDKIEYTFDVNWKGWQVITVPIDRFKDSNSGVGDNVWNPSKDNGSGGLLHFQLIFLANGKKGNINVAIDNIKLVEEKIKK